MISQEFIYFVVWVFISVALAFLIFLKIKFFKKPAGFLILFLAALFSILLHNLIYVLFDFEEALFFIITFLSFGTGISLFWIWLIGILKNKTAIVLAITALTIIFGLFFLLVKTETEETLPINLNQEIKLSYDVGGCQEKEDREYKKIEAKKEIADFEIVDNFINLTHYLNYVCCADIKVYLEKKEYSDYTLIKLKEKNEGEMCRCVCDYEIGARIGPLKEGKYLVQIFGVEFEDQPSEFLFEKEISINNSVSDKEKSCEDLCGDGICQEIVCMAIGCPCAETLESCPEDCSK